MAKILVIGGTGMLWRASATLHQQSHQITLLARSKSKVLTKLAKLNAPEPSFIEVDYHDAEALRAALDASSYECVVSWIHGSAPDALDIILETTRPERLIHVLGSASADPSTDYAMRLEKLYARRLPLYQQVILGFARCSNGSTRWLTHDEIAQGVLDAFASQDPLTIVGITRPWSDRP